MLTVVGNTTVDVLVKGLSRLPHLNGDGPPAPIIMQTEERVAPTLGGSGAVAAYTAAALGEFVRLWSAVGGDSFGELALSWLEGRKVDTASVRIMGEAGTSTNVIVESNKQWRETFHYAGASGLFVPRARAITGGLTDWLLFAGYSQLPRWRGDNTLEVLRSARKGGINTALDLGPGTGEAIKLDEIESMLPHVGILFSDASEFGRVTGREANDGARWAIEKGTSAVVLRDGARLALVFEAGDAKAGEESIEMPAIEGGGTSERETGAIFDAGFLFARTRGVSLEQCARFANATVSLVRNSARGVLDAPDEATVRQFLERNQ